MKKKLTPEFVKAFYRDMLYEFGATLITQEEFIKMLPQYPYSKWLLDGIDSLLPDKYKISNVSWTIGGNITVNFTPGEGSEDELENQIMILCHELSHVGHWSQEGFAIDYATSRSRRGYFEMLANQPVLEVSWYLNKKLPDINKMAAKLEHRYLCRITDVVVAQKHLKSYSRIVRAGGISTKVGKAAITLLKAGGY